MRGHFCLILHAHLPFVRHPEHDDFLEEGWLYEAVAECYLPLISVLEGLRADEIPVRIALTLTPTLGSMLRDPLLRSRCVRWLDRLVDLAAREVRRNRADPALQALAKFHFDRFERARSDFQNRFLGDLVGAFRRFQDEGALEILASAATHAYLPLWQTRSEAVRAQVSLGIQQYRGVFGRDPKGFWLPECGYFPGVEEFLRKEGIRYFVVDSGAILDAEPSPRYGVFAPLATSNRVAAFGRDPQTSIQVWSAEEGFPGHPDYREFYRDIGFDLPPEQVSTFVLPTGIRRATGIKYHRVTGGAGEKAPYDRGVAVAQAQAHAREFVASRTDQFRRLSALMGPRRPVVVAPFDAELFGHWWFEGPEFLDAVIRESAGSDAFELATPTDHLESAPVLQEAALSLSSWGEGGYSAVWLDRANAWMYPRLFSATRQLADFVGRNGTELNATRQRALRQAARELLLAQSSDWAFMLKAGTTAAYAQRRVSEHLANFSKLQSGLASGRIDGGALERMESRNNLFPALDPGLFAADAHKAG